MKDNQMTSLNHEKSWELGQISSIVVGQSTTLRPYIAEGKVIPFRKIP